MLSRLAIVTWAGTSLSAGLRQRREARHLVVRREERVALCGGFCGRVGQPRSAVETGEHGQLPVGRQRGLGAEHQLGGPVDQHRFQVVDEVDGAHPGGAGETARARSGAAGGRVPDGQTQALGSLGTSGLRKGEGIHLECRRGRARRQGDDDGQQRTEHRGERGRDTRGEPAPRRNPPGAGVCRRRDPGRASVVNQCDTIGCQRRSSRRRSQTECARQVGNGAGEPIDLGIRQRGVAEQRERRHERHRRTCAL